jgi:gliding motility-associated-like protein
MYNFAQIISFLKQLLPILFIFFFSSNLVAGNCISRSDSLILSRQSQVDSFPINYSGCNRVTGKLIISGNNITSLQALNVLNHVEFLNIRDNPLIISLNGLNNLQTAGNIIISHNESLLSLNGLESLDSVTANLEVKYNLSLVTLDGLNGLQKVKNTLSVFSNSTLTSLDGLESVLNVSRLSIYGNPMLTSLLGIDSAIILKTIDIWVNESLTCCELVNKIKANNPAILLNNIFSNDVGCSNITEIVSSSGGSSCCKTEFKVNTVKICSGDQITIGANTYTIPGIYIDTFISSSGCDSILYTELSIGSPSLTKIQRNLCTGQQLTLSNGRVITSSGIYTDTIPFSCDSIVEYTISFSGITTIRLDTLVCEGQTFILPGGQSVITSGIYTDTIKSGSSCDSVFISTVTFFQNNFSTSLNAEETVNAGDSILLQPRYENGIPSSWNWLPSGDLSCLDCENPIAKPQQNTIYNVSVNATNGCVDTASVVIKVPISEIFVPTAFTPNGDRVNDDFDVFFAGSQSFSIKIYNRYSELVFISNDISTEWNGTYKNQPATADNYVYIIEVTLFNQQKIEKKGSVLLLR